MKESDLYGPIKRFLESQRYEVKGEVKDCDVVAVRAGEPPVVVELKLTLTLDLVLQAVARLVMTPKVYLGVPRRCGPLTRRRRQILKLLRMLGLGLVTVEHLRRTVRVGDPNLGGTAMKLGIVTAYRQRAVAIGHFLQEQGPTKASAVAAATGDPQARAILSRDVYGWFERQSIGVYRLSPRGTEALVQWGVPRER